MSAPRGAVKLTKLEDGSWIVDCAACGFRSPEPPYKHCRAGAEEYAKYHRATCKGKPS